MDRRSTALALAAALILGLAGCGARAPAPDPTPTAASTPAPSPGPSPIEDLLEVEDLMRVCEDIPGVIGFDVALPKLTADTPGAAAINGQIEQDYAVDLTAGRTGDHSGLGVFAAYGNPGYHIWYETYAFGSAWEICIIGEEGSRDGSGVGLWVDRYYYDGATGQVMPEEDFLALAGYTREDVLGAFYEQIVEPGDGPYAYEDFAHNYYVDGDGELVLWTGMYS